MINQQGYSVFNQGPSYSTKHKFFHITKDDYLSWKKEFSFEALKGIRYGQSFCNRFSVQDYVLFYMIDTKRADLHIREQYID